MITDDKVTVKNKKLLEQIREEGEGTNGRNSDDRISSEGYAESRGSGYIEDEGRTEGAYQRNQGRTQGDARVAGATEGRNSGIRPLNGASVNAGESLDTGNRQARNNLSVVETPQERKAREDELHRQRQQTYRDRLKAAREAENVTSRQSVSDGPQFHLKNPFAKRDAEKQSAKLFSNKEAEDELARMKNIYFRGSGLLDDVLEIVVKDHEPVQIWQLSEEEAVMLAEMHLERAKKDIGAARSARKLLEIYDRLYVYILLGPRLKATGSHVKAHGGFSFR